MAAITGITGSAAWGGTGIHAHLLGDGSTPISFDLDAPLEVFDGTGFDVTQESRQVAGIKMWSARITSLLDTPAIGSAGSVTVPSGYAANIRQWALSLRCRVHNTTDFTAAAAGWHTFTGGLIDGSGSWEGLFDSSTAAVVPGSHSSAVFVVNNERKFTANIIANGMGVRSSPGDVNTITYPFVTNGAITAGQDGSEDAEPIVPDSTTGTGWVEAATELVLTASTGQTFTGNAFWSSLDITCPAAGLVQVAIGVQGTGSLTPA